MGGNMEWKRKGECNHCGFCCLFLATEPHVLSFPREALVDKNGGLDEAHAKVRGLVPQSDGAMAVPAWFYSPCSAFSTEELRCGIQETKPTICKDYPWVPEQVVGTPCSYWFEKVEYPVVEGCIADYGETTYRQGGQGSPHPGRSAEREGQVLLDASAYFNIRYPIITTQSLMEEWKAKCVLPQ